MFYELREVFIMFMFKRKIKTGGYVRKATAILLVFLMTLGALSACSGGNSDNNADTYGTGTYTTEETADGWILVKNEGGIDLGYSEDSGVELIEDDGYAFKDLNRNGELDVYEDWRQDADARVENLTGQLSENEILGLMIHDSVFGLEEDGSDGTTGDELSFNSEMDKGVRSVLNFASSGLTSTVVAWTNAAQSYVESKDFGIPLNVSANPSSFGDYTWPENLALAATFDTELVADVSKEQSKHYRALGISTLLGPQIDVSSEPRWSRIQGTYGEDPALSADMTNAVISGLQSTYDESGADLGWGIDSVIAMMKHFPSDGPGEGGREAHADNGKYNVYPGNAFKTGLIPFIDGGLNLDSNTSESAAVMTSYSIAYSDDGSYGDLVGSAFSEYKINILRDTYGYDGLICTDWGVVGAAMPGGGMSLMPWGVEDKTEVERQYLAIKAGVDQLGGDGDPMLQEAYTMLKDDIGMEAALEQIQASSRRILKTFFEVGLFENPYLSLSDATATVNNDKAKELSYESQIKSIVMLKNEGDIIKAISGDEKPTVYIPMSYVPPGPAPGSVASWSLPVDESTLSEYFNVVTDTLGKPSGPAGEDGQATFTENDIKRASKAELANCDYSLVFVNNPSTGKTIGNGYDDATETYLPISLQYGEYAAASEGVRKNSIAGDAIIGEIETPYGNVQQESKENRSYYGKTAEAASNVGDLDLILSTTNNMPENAGVIVAVNATNPMIFSEFESEVDGILIAFGTNNNAAFLDIVTGKTEPSGLLPVQMPKDMETVEAQDEDVPRDMECYVDSAGNTYDFAFGLNWSGVINDDRVAKYSVPALTEPVNKGK
jgi:beta-glucosidase